MIPQETFAKKLAELSPVGLHPAHMPCFLRKSAPKMQGHTKFLQTMKSFLYSFVPILNSHLVIPIGQRLVPFADFMLQLCMVLVAGSISC